jgi:hypothetical protein
MRTHPTTFAVRCLRAAAVAALAAAAGIAGCAAEPDTVLQTDLPQVPGMVARDTTGLKQREGAVVGGQFAYKGPIPEMAARVDEVKGKFALYGWRLASEQVSGTKAMLEFEKGSRRASVELIRNGVQPKMSTAVLRVQAPGLAVDAPEAEAPKAEPAAPAPAPAAPKAP